MGWQLVASYFTVNSTDIFYSLGINRSIDNYKTTLYVNIMKARRTPKYLSAGLQRKTGRILRHHSIFIRYTVDLQWLEQAWNDENILETGAV